jgi:hypothetical protein
VVAAAAAASSPLAGCSLLQLQQPPHIAVVERRLPRCTSRSGPPSKPNERAALFSAAALTFCLRPIRHLPGRSGRCSGVIAKTSSAGTASPNIPGTSRGHWAAVEEDSSPLRSWSCSVRRRRCHGRDGWRPATESPNPPRVAAAPTWDCRSCVRYPPPTVDTPTRWRAVTGGSPSRSN